MRAIKFGIGLIIALASSTAAQSVVATGVSQNTQTSSSVRNVTFAFNNTSLSAALDELAQKSGTKITYSGDLVLNKRVSARGTNMDLRNALTQVLAGTQLTVVEEGSQIIIVQSTRKSGNTSHGNITGHVTDAKTGRGISGANVSVGMDSRGVVTGEDGSYRLIGTSSGMNTVTVRLVGYAKQSKTVSVGDGATVTVDFKLEPSASVLNDVIVTGTIISTELKAVPTAITVITARQIEERGITRIDQLFRGDVPGLFSLNRGASASLDQVSMYSRGATAFPFGSSAGIDAQIGNSNPIKTYIDGVEMVNPKYLSQIDPKSIERIEILTGPQASTIYGANAINGVMQIFTKRGSYSKPQIILSVTSGIAQNNFSSRLAPEYITDVQISGMESRWSYSIGGSWDYIGSWTPSKQTQRLSINSGNKLDLGKLIVDLSARRGLTRNRQNANSNQGLTDLIATGELLGNAPQGISRPATESLTGKTLGFSLHYRPYAWWSFQGGAGSDASATLFLQASAIYGSPSDTALSVSPSSTSRVSQYYNTTIHLSLSSLADLDLTIGGDRWRTTGSSWDSNPLSSAGIFQTGNFTRNKPDKNSGAYLQGQLGIKDILFITYGVREDWNPNFGEKVKAKPSRYGVSYTTDIGALSVKLRGSYGRSIRPPGASVAMAIANTNVSRLMQFGYFDIQLANPDLGPEFQQGGEGGMELYFSNKASFVVTRYNQTVDNLITSVFRIDSVPSLLPVAPSTTNCNIALNGTVSFDTEGHCFRYQSRNLNSGSIRNQGWELQSRISLGSFTTNGTYSWTKSRVLGITPKYRAILASDPTFQPGRPFDFIPEHTWALGATYSNSTNTASISVNGNSMSYKSGVADVLSLMSSANTRLITSKPRMDLSGYRALGAGYTTSYFNATHRFSSKMDAVLQIDNLTNNYQNDYSAQYATIGRQTKLGFRIRFQ